MQRATLYTALLIHGGISAKRIALTINLSKEPDPGMFSEQNINRIATARTERDYWTYATGSQNIRPDTPKIHALTLLNVGRYLGALDDLWRYFYDTRPSTSQAPEITPKKIEDHLKAYKEQEHQLLTPGAATPTSTDALPGAATPTSTDALPGAATPTSTDALPGDEPAGHTPPDTAGAIADTQRTGIPDQTLLTAPFHNPDLHIPIQPKERLALINPIVARFKAATFRLTKDQRLTLLEKANHSYHLSLPEKLLSAVSQTSRVSQANSDSVNTLLNLLIHLSPDSAFLPHPTNEDELNRTPPAELHLVIRQTALLHEVNTDKFGAAPESIIINPASGEPYSQYTIRRFLQPSKSLNGATHLPIIPRIYVALRQYLHRTQQVPLPPFLQTPSQPLPMVTDATPAAGPDATPAAGPDATQAPPVTDVTQAAGPDATPAAGPDVIQAPPVTDATPAAGPDATPITESEHLTQTFLGLHHQHALTAHTHLHALRPDINAYAIKRALRGRPDSSLNEHSAPEPSRTPISSELQAAMEEAVIGMKAFRSDPVQRHESYEHFGLYLSRLYTRAVPTLAPTIPTLHLLFALAADLTFDHGLAQYHDVPTPHTLKEAQKLIPLFVRFLNGESVRQNSVLLHERSQVLNTVSNIQGLTAAITADHDLPEHIIRQNVMYLIPHVSPPLITSVLNGTPTAQTYENPNHTVIHAALMTLHLRQHARQLAREIPNQPHDPTTLAGLVSAEAQTPEELTDLAAALTAGERSLAPTSAITHTLLIRLLSLRLEHALNQIERRAQLGDAVIRERLNILERHTPLAALKETLNAPTTSRLRAALHAANHVLRTP